jgi:hypothetical protein
MKRLAGSGTVDKLNRPNLDDAMTFRRVKAGSLGVDCDFAHGNGVTKSSVNLFGCDLTFLFHDVEIRANCGVGSLFIKGRAAKTFANWERRTARKRSFGGVLELASWGLAFAAS